MARCWSRMLKRHEHRLEGMEGAGSIMQTGGDPAQHQVDRMWALGCQSMNALPMGLWPTSCTALSFRVLGYQRGVGPPWRVHWKTARLGCLVPGRGTPAGSFLQLPFHPMKTRELTRYSPLPPKSPQPSLVPSAGWQHPPLLSVLTAMRPAYVQ